MSNDFDCNISNTATNKVNQKPKKEQQSEKVEINDNSQPHVGSSLNLQPSAVAGRSMIDVKIPDKPSDVTAENKFDEQNQILADGLSKINKSFGEEVVDKAIKVFSFNLQETDVEKIKKNLKELETYLIINEYVLKDITDDDIEFIKNVSERINKNLLKISSGLFYMDERKHLSEEEKQRFVDWIDFCDKYAEMEDKENYYLYDYSDKKNFADNVSKFLNNPAIRDNTYGSMKLIETMRQESSRSTLYDIIKERFNNKTAEDIDNINKSISLMDNFYYLDNVYYSLDKTVLKDQKLKNTPNYYAFYAEYNNIVKLLPLAKKFKLNIELPIFLTKREKDGNPVNDEYIKKVEDAVKDVSQNNTLTSEIVSQMILDDKNFDHYNKWLHFIEKNIKSDIKDLPITKNILYNIIFPKLKNVTPRVHPYQIELYQKLLENKEILEAVKNMEFDISNGLKITQKINRNKLITEKEAKTGFNKALEYQKQENQLVLEDFLNNCSEDVLVEYIMRMNNKYSFKTPNLDYPSIGIYVTPDIEDLVLLETLATKSKPEIMENLKKIEALKEKTLKHYELYLNGVYSNSELAETRVEDFFNVNSLSLLKLVALFDKESIDVLMRKRFEYFKDYMDDLMALTPKEEKLLKRLLNSLNADGEPFKPKQKIEFIDLLEGFKDNNLGTEKIEQMINSENGGRVDITQLKIDLFNRIMINSGFSEKDMNSMSKEKFIEWDLKKIHLLAKTLKEAKEAYDKNVFEDIIKATNLADFKSYINDISNVYGRVNAKTRQIYKDMNLDYEKWINPPKKYETDFISRDSNQEQLNQIASQITEDMNAFMQTPVGTHIKKQFPNFVKENRFVIPNTCLTSKSKLQSLVKTIIDTSQNGKMSAVWKRAKFNAEGFDPVKKATAQNTLTIKGHLEQRYKDLNNVNDIKIAKDLNWKIKMWDRNPQKDLFQGNYSTCCIGMGESNGTAMPHYLMNNAYNMIEIVDNESEKIVGNALCYFVKTEDDKPAFVIDNIEININYKPSTEAGKKLRTAIADYASKIAAEVTGKDDTPVFMSNQFNDVPFNDLPMEEQTITFLGDIDCLRIYMDLFGKSADWTHKSDFTQTCNVLRLK